ncbi:ferredoxin [Actinomadura sp. LD22]|uniref:Ferredoxin n=1 Tax=Actinomadura physcomitrii TaxID=2650748 RepID=A0A6I4M1I9_9ACTN|nr:ferredoxin [Actinomadura physcomitrii]MVZ99787.1 ferredoxin [Actinomadura physcomitrii]
MRIKLDRTLCDGFGICGVHAPESFSIDEWGYASLAAPLAGSGEVPTREEDGVRRAVLDCPVHAITELPEAGRPVA